MSRPRSWAVLARPAAAGDDPDLVLVKDGFCWPALFLPVPWLLWRRQWLGLIAYLASAAALALAVRLAGMDDAGAAAAAALFALLVAEVANDWRCWRLEAAGYRLRGVVAADGLEAAERRVLGAPEWPLQPAAVPGLYGEPAPLGGVRFR